MRLSKLLLAPLGLAVLTLGGLKASAIEPAKKAEDKPAAQQTTEAPAAPLTDDALKEMLVNLGFTPEVTKSTDGANMYLIAFERDNYRYVMYVSLSSDKSMIWLATPLGTLPEPAKVPEDILEKLLLKTDEIGPAHFGLKGRRLYLSSPLRNLGVKPADLRREIDGLATDVRQTEPLWNPAKWPNAAKDNPMPPVVENKDKK